MEISELLDKAKNRANLPSDYALAKALGVPTGNITNIRKGRAHPSNEIAVQLATLAGLDEMQVIAEIELQTAKSETKREFWKSYIEKRGIATCIAMTITTGMILQNQNYANAETGNNALKNNDLYIMRITNLF